MYFIKRNGRYIDVAGKSFRDFMDGKLDELPGERAQFLRQTELQIEVAVIDRTHLDGQRRRGKLARGAGVTGHAVNHGFRFKGRMKGREG